MESRAKKPNMPILLVFVVALAAAVVTLTYYCAATTGAVDILSGGGPPANLGAFAADDPFRAGVAAAGKVVRPLTRDPLPNHVVLDRRGRFHLYWLPGEDIVTFEVQVETHGWIGLGFTTDGRMKGADIVMMWMDDDVAATPYLDDRHGIGHRVPLIDASQDYDLIEGLQNDTHTVFRFSRKWDTCDPDDMVLNGDTVKIIWAMHPEKPKDKYDIPRHRGKDKGAKSVHLKEDRVARPPDDVANHLKRWDLRGRNVRLPNDDHTHYFCQVFKAPDLDRKHHMIGFEPLIQEGHESYVHHMVLYECHVAAGEPGSGSSDEWFARHARPDSQGEACYSPNMPPEWSFCLATNTWAWAVGSGGETLPDDAGIPLGEEYGGSTYFMLEIHYDNPAIDQDLVDTSGMRIFYTDRLRQHDAGMLLIGTEVNFLHMIPPGQESFLSLGRCASECTQQGLDEDGITIINGVLHSHLAGRKMRIRHFRGDRELPVMLEDNNYDFNFQSSRRPKAPSKVLPGDDLIVECEYGTKDREGPTFGGLSTKEEMCLGFMLYYPRQKLADCRSLPSLPTVMKTLGIEELHGDALQKLSTFLMDLGGGGSKVNSDGTRSLKDLLMSLALETGKMSLLESYSVASASQQIDEDLAAGAPLSEEDILKKPFYTVETLEPSLAQPPSVLGNLDLPQGTNYRNLLVDMLLSVRIQKPTSLENVTIQQRLAQLDWKDPRVARSVQDMLNFQPHNSVCLAHGRVAIRQYQETRFPFKTDEYEAGRVPDKSIKECVSGERTGLGDELIVGSQSEPFHSSLSPGSTGSSVLLPVMVAIQLALV